MQAEERAMLGLLPAALNGCNVLDAGCGSGRYLAHAWSRGAQRLVGCDLSGEMLNRARTDLGGVPARLLRASLAAIPLQDGWADLTICGLTIGHLEELHAPLRELCRVTRRGGLVLCSDVHPVGHTLGWRREFTAGGHTYAVRHTPHSREQWEQNCRELGLRIVAVHEPRLDPADIPTGAVFDPAALQVPVALVFALERSEIG
jgi:malonyl-CoA O-methyltransferase